MNSTNDLADLKTPAACIADFCLIPIGTPTASVSKEVAEVQRVLKRSGLEYHMHSAGTTVGTDFFSFECYVTGVLGSLVRCIA